MFDDEKGEWIVSYNVKYINDNTMIFDPWYSRYSLSSREVSHQFLTNILVHDLMIGKSISRFRFFDRSTGVDGEIPPPVSISNPIKAFFYKILYEDFDTVDIIFESQLRSSLIFKNLKIVSSDELIMAKLSDPTLLTFSDVDVKFIHSELKRYGV